MHTSAIPLHTSATPLHTSAIPLHKSAIPLHTYGKSYAHGLFTEIGIIQVIFDILRNPILVSLIHGMEYLSIGLPVFKISYK